MMQQPMTAEEFTRLVWIGVMIFIGAALGLGLVALGATIEFTLHPPEQYPRASKVCSARYVGEIAYWAEAPDNRMVCQRMDRESLTQRRCVGLDTGDK